jgi:uncharacterized membrane protein YagU involved in acid resistance
MRGGNSLKKVIIAGLIAGFVSGIVNFIFDISGFYELFSVLPHVFPMTVESLAIHNMIQSIMWGIIFCAFYAVVYDHIPGIGIKKGLVYGLIIWAIVVLRMNILNAIHLYIQFAITNTIAAFFSLGITYGLVLGYLYRKPSD